MCGQGRWNPRTWTGKCRGLLSHWTRLRVCYGSFVYDRIRYLSIPLGNVRFNTRQTDILNTNSTTRYWGGICMVMKPKYYYHHHLELDNPNAIEIYHDAADVDGKFRFGMRISPEFSNPIGILKSSEKFRCIFWQDINYRLCTPRPLECRPRGILWMDPLQLPLGSCFQTILVQRWKPEKMKGVLLAATIARKKKLQPANLGLTGWTKNKNWTSRPNQPRTSSKMNEIMLQKNIF